MSLEISFYCISFYFSFVFVILRGKRNNLGSGNLINNKSSIVSEFHV